MHNEPRLTPLGNRFDARRTSGATRAARQYAQTILNARRAPAHAVGPLIAGLSLLRVAERVGDALDAARAAWKCLFFCDRPGQRWTPRWGVTPDDAVIYRCPPDGSVHVGCFGPIVRAALIPHADDVHRALLAHGCRCAAVKFDLIDRRAAEREAHELAGVPRGSVSPGGGDQSKIQNPKSKIEPPARRSRGSRPSIPLPKGGLS